MLTPMRAITLGAVVVVLTACGGPPTMQDQPSPEFAQVGLHRMQSFGFEEAYASPDAMLSSYRDVNIEQLDLANVEVSQRVVEGTIRRNWQMNPERGQELQQAWNSAMHRAFADYERTGSGDKVLRVSAELIRIAPRIPNATTITSVPQPIGFSEAVEISAEFRCYDQASNALLLVIRDRRTIGAIHWPRTEQSDMGILFNSWASLLHTRISGSE